MINSLKNIFGLGTKVDYAQLIGNGAIVLDVRSRSEYAGGHVNGSINIPLDQLKDNLPKLKNKERAIITCCASGIRSSSAKSILKQEGYTHVYNGGSWQSLKQYDK